MPYLTTDQKAALDLRGVSSLATYFAEEDDIRESTGALTYVTYRLMCAFVTPRRRFWLLALAGGAVLYAILEFYRRVVGPYEDQKILENGDLKCETESSAAALH